MMLLNTRFNVDKDLTRQVFLSMIKSYLKSSDRYSDLTIDDFDWNMDDYQSESKDSSIRIILNNYEKRFIFQMITDDVDLGETYTTTYVLDDVSDVPSLHLTQEKLFKQMTLSQGRDNVRLPILLKDIFWCEYGGNDNGVSTDNKAFILRKDDVALGVKILESLKDFRNPIVYVSPHSQTGYYELNYDYVAQELMGQAHVIVEGSPRVSKNIQNSTDVQTPFNGAVKIFLPDGTSTILLANGKGFNTTVINSVRKTMTQLSIDDSFNVNKIRQQHMFAKFDDGGELSKLCDEMLADKDREIEEKNAKISELTQQLIRESGKANALQHGFNKVTENDESGVFLSMEESDLYDGEMKDVILKLVKKEYESMKDDINLSKSRKFHVLKDILDHNFPSETDTDLIECLRSAFNDGTLTREGIGRLQSVGFVVEKDGKQAHYKIKYGDDRYMLTAPSTPGDKSRGIKNLISEFSNMLFGF